MQRTAYALIFCAMMWIDRLALVWAALVVFVYFVMCYGQGGLDPVFWRGAPYFLLWFALPPWALLRGLHWAFARRGS